MFVTGDGAQFWGGHVDSRLLHSPVTAVTDPISLMRETSIVILVRSVRKKCS